MKKISLTTILLLIFSFLIFLNAKSISAQTLANQLSGKILLQVEEHGEAWYVNPADEKRYYLGRPNDALNLMKELGVGITTDNLKKIQVADANLAGSTDDDGDGLSNMAEDSFGTNRNSADSDSDSYADKTEILNGYSPTSASKLPIDNKFAASQKGKILLQVEQHGEAWYVNPDNSKRYFLGRPQDAFNLMRKLGLGISNNDLNKITQHEAEMTNCSSMDCLISLAQSCEKGELVYDFSGPYPLGEGMTINTKTYFKINGKGSNGLCAFIQQSQGGTVAITEEGRQKAIEQGLTGAEIDVQIQQINNSMNSDIVTKSVMTCSGANADIATYLTNTEQGSGSTSCTATLGENETRCTVEPNLSCVTRTP